MVSLGDDVRRAVVGEMHLFCAVDKHFECFRDS